MIKQARKFTYVVLGILILFFIFNFLTWNLYTKTFFSMTAEYNGGDLARLSYYKNANELKFNKITLPKKHIELKDYEGQKIDVITIGDSFSNGVTGGLNPYYQDYLASYSNLSVLNITPYKDKNTIETLYIMKNNGFIDKIKPKIILFENVERTSGMLLADNLNQAANVSLNEFIESYKNNNNSLTSEPPGSKNIFKFITDANIRCYLYDVLYLFSDNPEGSQVCIKKTTKPLFSAFGNKILFVGADILGLSYNNPENIIKINNNLNQLADYYKKKNIKFYFMSAVDKYDLYYDFIENNKYQKPIFFDEIRKLPKTYYFIDTKAILDKELAKRTKDIFYKDDTHWSYVANRAIAKYLTSNLKKQEKK